MVSSPPSPSNSLSAAPVLSTPALPALVLDAVNPVALKTSSKLVPRTASMECSVSCADRGIAIHGPRRQVDDYSASDIVVETKLIEHTIEAAAAVNIVVAAAPLEDFRTVEVVAAQQRVIEVGAADDLDAGETYPCRCRKVARGGPMTRRLTRNPRIKSTVTGPARSHKTRSRCSRVP